MVMHLLSQQITLTWRRWVRNRTEMFYSICLFSMYAHLFHLDWTSTDFMSGVGGGLEQWEQCEGFQQ